MSIRETKEFVKQNALDLLNSLYEDFTQRPRQAVKEEVFALAYENFMHLGISDGNELSTLSNEVADDIASQCK